MSQKHTLSKFVLLATSLTTASPIITFAATWEAVGAVNTARDQFAAGVIDNKIYIFGGNDSHPEEQVLENDLQSTEMLNLDQPSVWSYLVDNNGNGANGLNGAEELTGAGFNGKFYVFGGSQDTGTNTFNFVEEYDPAGDTWSTKAAMPTTRTASIAAAYNNEIYIFGGDYFPPAPKKDIHYKVVEAYNPATDLWRKVTQLPQLRLLPAVTVVGDKAYVIGGSDVAKKTYNNVYAYDFIANKWKTTGLTPLPTPRSFSFAHAAPVLNGKIYLIGGTATQKTTPHLVASTKVEIYDPASNTWQIGPALPQASEGGATVVANNAIYVISGGSQYDTSSSLVKNVWKLTDAWKANITTLETCDLNADSKFSAVDVTLFTKACQNNSAYWQCDLNNDSAFTAKDTAAYKLQWKKATKACSDGVLANAFQYGLTNLQVEGEGKVIKILSDDTYGSKHQRFIIRLSTLQTLLVAHNIDIAPRIATLKVGDNLQFNGEYEWDNKGGVMHWTHHDPDNQHVNGWIKHAGITYQ